MSNASSQPALFPVLILTPFPPSSLASFIIIAMARVEITMSDRTAVLFLVYLPGMYLSGVLSGLGGSSSGIGVVQVLRWGVACVRVVELSSLTCVSASTMVSDSMAI